MSALAQVQLPTQAELDDECSRRSLAAYTRRAWHIVEPGRPYVHGWHIDAICEHLEAVYRRQIRNLIVNIQPRYMKSLLVGVFWPTWVWGPMRQPESRWLCASYAEQLAIRDNLKSRRIIESPWYRRRWGQVFRLSGDQNMKQRYENTHMGYRIAVGIGGGATGEGGDYLLFDDPHKLSDDGSPANIENACDWVSSTMSTRGNDPDTFVRVIIMQRVAPNDVTGYVIEKAQESGEHWEVLCLPTEYERREFVSTIGWKDPRTKEGELLWPERFDRKRVNILKAELGPARAASQMQQRPKNPGGVIMLREWWAEGQNRFRLDDSARRSNTVARFLSFDTALTDTETSAFTACVTGELAAEYRMQIVNCVRRRLTFPDLSGFVSEMIRTNNADGRLHGVIIEHKGSGISLVQTMMDALPADLRKLVIAYTPDASKPVRWQIASVWCQNGSVMLPHPAPAAGWLFDFEEELYDLPGSKYRDQADAFAQLIDYTRNLLAEGLRARMGG